MFPAFYSAMENSEIIDRFIKNFVLKNRRERADLELKNADRRNQFANRLNHSWDKVLDMRWISRIADRQDDYEFVKAELKVADNDRCYLISNYDDIDGSVMEFKAAFRASYGRGFATIIVTVSGDKLYLETEIDYGKQSRFVGRR
jgi:hypothetical protein